MQKIVITTSWASVTFGLCNGNLGQICSKVLHQLPQSDLSEIKCAAGLLSALQGKFVRESCVNSHSQICPKSSVLQVFYQLFRADLCESLASTLKVRRV
ncbi:hypothetical protein ACS0TY_011873 [Phlomoides rotata]